MAASAWLMPRPIPWPPPVTSAVLPSSSRGTVGNLGERFGVQVAQLLGAAEHRSARIDRCVSEERRSQRRRWVAWAPKIRRGGPAVALSLVASLAWEQRLSNQTFIRGHVPCSRLSDDIRRELGRV